MAEVLPTPARSRGANCSRTGAAADFDLWCIWSAQLDFAFPM